MLPESFQQRVHKVCTLKAGWLGDPGEPGPDIDIDPVQVLRLVEALHAQGYPLPVVVPTIDGLVELEWANGLTLEIHTMPQPWPRP